MQKRPVAEKFLTCPKKLRVGVVCRNVEGEREREREKERSGDLRVRQFPTTFQVFADAFFSNEVCALVAWLIL